MICKLTDSRAYDTDGGEMNGVFIVNTNDPERSVSEMTEAYGCHVELLRKTEMESDFRDREHFEKMISELRQCTKVTQVMKGPPRAIYEKRIEDIKCSDSTPLEKIDAMLKEVSEVDSVTFSYCNLYRIEL